MGSGAVYLTDYLNVDVPNANTFLARDRPDLVERWRTTESDYYGKHQDKTIDALRAGPLNQEYVCDIYGDFLRIPVGSYECDELLSRHVFEHLSIREARSALRECYRVMKRGGLLRLDVPDSEATLERYRETGDPIYKRHFLGPRRNDYGFHLPYTKGGLRALVESCGFVFVQEEPNIHWEWLPAFCLRFQKKEITS